MNHPSAGQPPPMIPPSPKKAAPVALIVLGVFALLVVLAVAGGVRAFHAAQEDSEAAIVVGDSCMGNMGQHEYQNARALMTPQMRARTTTESLEDGESLTEKYHGAFLNHGEPQWNVQNFNGRTSVQLTYPAQFSKSDSPVSLVMVDGGDGYQVYAVRYGP